MRRSYISPEYQNKAVSGTLNMLEERLSLEQKC
jgi:hypothetical protein